MKRHSICITLALTLTLATLTPLAGAGDSPHSGLDLAGADPAIRVQDDLFGAMNGRWLENTAIPADKSAWGSFHQLRDLSDQRIKVIVDDIAARKPVSGIEQKIADFHGSFMNTASIDARGAAALSASLAQIDAIQNSTDLARLLGQWQGVINTPLILAVGPDDKDTRTNIPQIWQSGLGLPDRDYFLKDDAKFVAARAAYRDYLSTLLKLAGSTDAPAEAARVFALEHEIATLHWDRVSNRDPLKIYNPMNAAALARHAPGMNWTAYFEGAGLGWSEKIIVSQPNMVTGLGELLSRLPLPTWKLYLRVRLQDSLAGVLPQAWRDASFAFHGKTLQGLEQEKPRWQLAAAAINDALGEAVGQVYVSRHFPPAHKARMQALVAQLMAAYRQSIDTLAWMTPATKQRAQEKLAAYTTKIGYPDIWRDYSAVVIRADDAYGNVMRARRADYSRKTVQAGKPVDRREWGMTPQTVNAYYHPNFNEIVFPAAILQPPFFDMAADDAVNYGAIGAVIGHEISHGFDDQGSQFDGQGNLNSWWSADDRAAFNALGERLVKQFENYEPLPGKKINGRLTLGENIADLSGLQIAYKAWKLSLAGKPAPVIDGKRGDERFFLSFAQIWRSKLRDELALQRLTTDTHSPSKFRANGAAENADAFHATFGTHPGDKMYKPEIERIRIW